MQKPDLVHHTAVIDHPCSIGEGTRIWHFSHVMQGASIGSNCTLGQNTFVGTGVRVGNRVKIQNGVSLYTGVSIDDDVFIGPSVVFTNDLYPRSKKPCQNNLTHVQCGASIGANATIICGVHIGKNAMVGAGSVVTNDIPDHALVYGNPARIQGWTCACGTKISDSTSLPPTNLQCITCSTATKHAMLSR